MDPIFPGNKHLQREKCFFRNNYFSDHRSFLLPAISLRFFCVLANNFSDMLFQVLSTELPCWELSLLKVERRVDALSVVIKNSSRYSQ